MTVQQVAAIHKEYWLKSCVSIDSCDTR